MFAQNCWYMALDKEDVTKDKPVSVRVCGHDIVMYRDSKGKVIALADRCPHRLAPLSEGRIEGDEIRCMYHGQKYDREGKCTLIPGQDAIPKVLCTEVFAVHEGHEWISVWIGDQSKADYSLVPNQHFHDPAVFNVRKGSVPFAANYELFNDNTTDLSHVSYVHASTFAQLGDKDWIETHPQIGLQERSVKVDRWILNTPSPFVDSRIDFVSRFEHVLPGWFIMDLLAYPVGTAEEHNFEFPDENVELLHRSCTIQVMRPIDEKTSMFHYSITSPKWVSEEALDGDFAFAQKGFMEDKAMIEAQQRVIDANPDIPLRNTSHDKAGSHIRKLIRATLEAA